MINFPDTPTNDLIQALLDRLEQGFYGNTPALFNNLRFAIEVEQQAYEERKIIC